MGVAAPMTPDRHAEHLARADRHIAELRSRISHQLEIVERLRSYGISHQDREDLLAVLGESLRILQRHREADPGSTPGGRVSARLIMCSLPRV
jgi:hypothetical protein